MTKRGGWYGYSWYNRGWPQIKESCNLNTLQLDPIICNLDPSNKLRLICSNTPISDCGKIYTKLVICHMWRNCTVCITLMCVGGNHFVAELCSFCILVVYYVTCVFWWLYCTAVGNHSADQAWTICPVRRRPGEHRELEQGKRPPPPPPGPPHPPSPCPPTCPPPRPTRPCPSPNRNFCPPTPSLSPFPTSRQKDEK